MTESDKLVATARAWLATIDGTDGHLMADHLARSIVALLGDKTATPPPTTPEQIIAEVELFGLTLRQRYGPRSAVIVLAGIEQATDNQHDIFACKVAGTCLLARGLLAWGARNAERQIDAADSSTNKLRP